MRSSSVSHRVSLLGLLSPVLPSALVLQSRNSRSAEKQKCYQQKYSGCDGGVSAAPAGPG